MKLENEILLIFGDDILLYVVSQLLLVVGLEWLMENSMDDFLEGFIKEEDSILDVEDLDIIGDDYLEFRVQLSIFVLVVDQCKLLQ